MLVNVASKLRLELSLIRLGTCVPLKVEKAPEIKILSFGWITTETTPWLAPVQAVVLNITDSQADYCFEVRNLLKNKGYRVEADIRNEKVGFKIREHSIQKVPYLLVVGDREVESGQVAVRARSGEDLGTMTIDEFSSLLTKEVEKKGRTA